MKKQMSIVLVFAVIFGIFTFPISASAVQGGTVTMVVNPSGWTVANNIMASNLATKGTRIYNSGSRYFFSWGKDFNLNGATAIQTSPSDATNATNTSATQTVWGSFTIDRSAEIYVFTLYKHTDKHMKFLGTDGYELVKDLDGNDVKVSGNDSASNLYHVYKKKVLVNDGQTATVNLGNMGPYGNTSYMYSVAVKWIDTTQRAPRTAEVTYSQSNWTVAENITASLSTGTYQYSDSTIRYWTFDESLDFTGMTAIQPSWYDSQTNGAGIRTKENGTWAVVNINNSADVYVLTEFPPNTSNYMMWLLAQGYEPVLNSQNGNVIVKNTNNKSYRVYKKSYRMNPGVSTDLSFGFLGDGGSNYTYSVIIDWVQNPIPPVAIQSTLSSGLTKLEENAQVNMKAYSDGSRVITSFNNTGLEGSTILQTYYHDRANPLCNIQYPEPDAVLSYVDWINLALGESATVYVATNLFAVNGYMDWLSQWTLCVDEQDVPKKVTVTGDEDFYLYKRTFLVNEGETVDVALKSQGFFGNRMYFAFIKPADAYQVEITSNTGGLFNTLPVEGAEAGEPFSLKIVADEGHYIKTITFNDVVQQIGALTYNYKSPAIKSDSTISIEFAKALDISLVGNTVYLQSFENKDITIYVALYDGADSSKQLSGITAYPVALVGGIPDSVELTVPQNSPGQTVRIMVWEDVTIKPLLTND